MPFTAIVILLQWYSNNSSLNEKERNSFIDSYHEHSVTDKTNPIPLSIKKFLFHMQTYTSLDYFL